MIPLYATISCLPVMLRRHIKPEDGAVLNNSVKSSTVTCHVELCACCGIVNTFVRSGRNTTAQPCTNYQRNLTDRQHTHVSVTYFTHFIRWPTYSRLPCLHISLTAPVISIHFTARASIEHVALLSRAPRACKLPLCSHVLSIIKVDVYLRRRW